MRAYTYTLLRRIGSLFFSTSLFFAQSRKRDDRCIMSCLSLCLSSSSLKEQCPDSRIQFLRVWDQETLADLIFALRQTLNDLERTVIDTIRFRSREIQRVSR